MAEKINRRDLIVKTAAELFIEQSYAATSVRQIAEAVGCTEAALYYHFKDGKRALLQSVIECNAPNFVAILDHCHQAGCLQELILTFSRELLNFWEKHGRLVQWISSEYSNLTDDEKLLFDQKKLKFHAELSRLVQRFVPETAQAQETAWLIMCASFGYQHLFIHLGLDELTDFSVETFTTKLAKCLSPVAS